MGSEGEEITCGLTAAEAAERLARDGPNLLVPQTHKPSALAWIARFFSDPMALLLIVTSATYVVLGDRIDALVAGIALAPIFLVSAVLERRAEVALERLADFTSPTARVRRNASTIVIPAREIVYGDLMYVQEGDVLAADGKLVDGLSLTFDESALTGESIPVVKSAAGNSTERAVFAGTTLQAGQGAISVAAVGAQTRYGRIGGLLGETVAPITLIERAIRRLVLQIGSVVVIACVGVIAIGRLHGDSWPIAIIAAVSLAMAAIPEELPIIYTLYLALGAWRLAKENTLVRRLGSVEALGSTSVICVDKTGTLTFGHIALVQPYAAASFDETSLLERALLASERDSFDPLEQAIETYAREHGVKAVHERGVLLAREAFDPHKKYASSTWNIDGRIIQAKKGAPEVLIGGDRADAPLREIGERMAREGMRVIAVAEGDKPVGLLGFADTIRPNIAQSVSECEQAGIRVVMITGDHPLTAAAVARSIGLEADPERMLIGDASDALDDGALANAMRKVCVISRAHPEQKLRIVRALQAQGEVVAMTGDGTNDAPALRNADIGIAMGEHGTEVARSAADMILLDDAFSTIVRAIRNGRRIFENMRRAFSYLIAFHAPLLCGAVLIPFFGAPLLLLPIHLVLLEIIVHPTSSLVFEADQASPDAMRKPPRPRDVGFFRFNDWMRPILLGGILSLAVLGLYLSELYQGMPGDLPRSVAIIAMVSGQSIIVLAERSPTRPFWSNFRPMPILWLFPATLAILPLLVYVPAFAQAMHMGMPDAAQWSLALGIGIACGLWFEPIKAFSRAKMSLNVM